jgi:four helix bundle protein
MEKIRPESVEDLEVFKRGHQLAIKIYKISDGFPKGEKFGLTGQMRRAAASIATNLMEGSHRLSRMEYRQFVGIAKGSAGELKYQLLLAKDLGYLLEEKYFVFRKEVDDISRMLSGLVKSLSTQK